MTELETAKGASPPGGAFLDDEIGGRLNLDLKNNQDGQENQAKSVVSPDKRRANGDGEIVFVPTIGFDTEYVNAHDYDEKLPPTENIALSYQAAGFLSADDVGQTIIHLTKESCFNKRGRVSLASLIGGMLERWLAVGAIKTLPDKMKLKLVAHFARADLRRRRKIIESIWCAGIP